MIQQLGPRFPVFLMFLMFRVLLSVTVALLTVSAHAAWKVENGRKVLSMRDDPVGLVARLPAEAASHGVTAYLQVECFRHPQLSGKMLGIVLSKETKPGPIAWRYKFDERPAVSRGPYTRTSLKVIGLGDATSEELKGTLTAKRLMLTLLPAAGEELTFSFDLSGASAAARAVPCAEKRP